MLINILFSSVKHRVWEQAVAKHRVIPKQVPGVRLDARLDMFSIRVTTEEN